MVNKKISLGIKTISIIYYTGAVLSIVFGLVHMKFLGDLLMKINFLAVISIFSSGIFYVLLSFPIIWGGFPLIATEIVIPLGMVLLGVLLFFVARGLWKGNQWARITAIIFSALWILFYTIKIIQGQIDYTIFFIMINAVIGGYLLFSQSVKDAFA